jgi:hypothetical protein
MIAMVVVVLMGMVDFTDLEMFNGQIFGKRDLIGLKFHNTLITMITKSWTHRKENDVKLAIMRLISD